MTLYVNPGTGADGTRVAGTESIPGVEIDLACRACGSPLSGDEHSAYAEAARRQITDLLHEGPRPAGPERPEPGADAGPCTGCRKPLIWDRSGSRVHDEWGEYLCPATHRAHQTCEDTA